MADEPTLEPAFDELSTLEHEDLASVVEMLTELGRMQRQGNTLDEMAAAMDRAGTRAPAGLPWSGPLVARILGVMDSVQTERAEAVADGAGTGGAVGAGGGVGAGATPRPASPAPPTPPVQPLATEPAAAPAAPTVERVARPVPPIEPDGPEPALSDAADIPTPPPVRVPAVTPSESATPARSATPAASAGSAGSATWVEAASPAGGDERFRRTQSTATLLVPVVVLLAAGVAAVVGLGLLDDDGSPQAATGADDQAAPTTASTTDTASTDRPTDDTGGDGATVESTDAAADDQATPSTIVVPATPPDGDEADMLSIRIEPDRPTVVDPETGEILAPATATIRADGRLHLEGAFPDQAMADRYIDGMGQVFGADNLVQSYTINAAAPPPATDEVALDKPVLFASGTAEIDPSYHEFLEACGDVLKLNPQITMSISAFTDSAGDAGFNLQLSRDRAQAIRDFYRDIDVPDRQLEPLAFGEAEPVADNSTEEGRQQNRRAMLRLLDVLAEG